MKRLMALTSVALVLLTLCAWTSDAWARAGGGKSAGNRGSRTAAPPAQQNAQPNAAPQAGPQGAVQPQVPQRSGWMGGLMGGLTGMLIGGAIGSLLFGGLGGGGLFGGIGMFEILLLGGLAFAVFAYLRRRQQPTPTAPYDYSAGQGQAQPSMATPAMESDLARGVRHIRQMDPAFDPERFVDTASDTFFAVQSAWSTRDMAPTRSMLSGEMYETLRKGCEQLRDVKRINRLDNIAMRSMQVTEAWQESGADFVTVHILASLLDYTVDESGVQVYEGSQTMPVKFEEYWTFTRPCGPNAWELSAIQQANDA